MLVFCVPGTLLNQFDERDIEKINNDDLYVWLFVKHKQKDVDKAIDMIVSILTCGWYICKYCTRTSSFHC